jgi:hypothetical protein
MILKPMLHLDDYVDRAPVLMMVTRHLYEVLIGYFPSIKVFVRIEDDNSEQMTVFRVRHDRVKFQFSLCNIRHYNLGETIQVDIPLYLENGKSQGAWFGKGYEIRNPDMLKDITARVIENSLPIIPKVKAAFADYPSTKEHDNASGSIE